jgi:hypothetical protein
MRKLIYGTLLVLAIGVGVAKIPCKLPCEVCGKVAYTEPLLARPFANWDTAFVHFECVDKIPYDPTAIDRIRKELGK